MLGVLWDAGPATVREVLERLPDQKERAYTTVLAAMQQMEKKGLLGRAAEMRGRAHVYKPAASRKRTMKPVLRGLVERAFGGRPAVAVQQLLGDSPPGPDEIAEIRGLLDEIERKRRDS